MNQGHFEPEANIPKFWQKKIKTEPTSMQKIAQKMGYVGKKRFRLGRKPCSQYAINIYHTHILAYQS